MAKVRISLLRIRSLMIRFFGALIGEFRASFFIIYAFGWESALEFVRQAEYCLYLRVFLVGRISTSTLKLRFVEV